MKIRFYQAANAFLLFFLTTAVSAQDTTKSVKSVLTNDEELWYMQPWVWVVGGVALLLLLIALFSGKRNKAKNRTDRVIITKTVRTESDVD
jgi:phosphoglycerol transferase MdoB-like AlkP superfamily enzyme